MMKTLYEAANAIEPLATRFVVSPLTRRMVRAAVAPLPSCARSSDLIRRGTSC